MWKKTKKELGIQDGREDLKDEAQRHLGRARSAARAANEYDEAEDGELGKAAYAHWKRAGKLYRAARLPDWYRGD
jgi:hypothetical protein